MLDKVTIRAAHFEKLAVHPERARESAIVIIGTGAFVAPISLIQELQAAAVEAAPARARKTKVRPLAVFPQLSASSRQTRTGRG
jgi:hypothetical protein